MIRIGAELSAIFGAFHQRLDRIVSTWTVLDAGAITVWNIIGLPVKIWSTAVLSWRVNTGSFQGISIITGIWNTPCSIITLGAAGHTRSSYCTSQARIELPNIYIADANSIHYNFITIRATLALAGSWTCATTAWTIAFKNRKDRRLNAPIIV